MLRENPIVAASIGLDGGALRFAAFLLSALYAGAAGALYVHTIRVISPEALEFPVMVTCLTMAVVGGSTRIAGAILGAVLLVHLPEWLRVLNGFYLIAYGALLLGVTVLAPYGAIGGLERLRERLFPTSPPPAPRAIVPQPRPDKGEAGPVLEIIGLAKRFGGVEALAGIDLSLAGGEILGLIGPNGSGKTTLVNCVAGLYPPDAGSIRFRGAPIDTLPPHAIALRGVARSFQSGNLVADMTALDAVAMVRCAVSGGISLSRGLASPGRDRTLDAARGEAMHYLTLLGAAAVAMQPCGSLSTGAARRVEIARALALAPAVLLLDEPASGLDEVEQADLARSFAAMATGGVALLIVEHNMPFLMALAHRVACLDRGRIVAEGSPATIRDDRRVVETYLGLVDPVPPGKPA
jgi:branched-chain amino acid transport system permease protein